VPVLLSIGAHHQETEPTAALPAPPSVPVYRHVAETRFARGGLKTKKKMKENSQCTYVLYLARIDFFYTCDAVIFLIAFLFLSSPYRKTPKNALKEISKGKGGNK
jgi:hypothetical protein